MVDDLREPVNGVADPAAPAPKTSWALGSRLHLPLRYGGVVQAAIQSRDARPGPSYLDDGSGGPDNDFTNGNITFRTWNLLHLGWMLKDAGGVTAHGNPRTEWDAGCRFDYPNREHR
jgi:hypothetical protein